MSYNAEKVNKVWSAIKTVVEVILAALGGLLTGVTAKAAGLVDVFANL